MKSWVINKYQHSEKTSWQWLATVVMAVLLVGLGGCAAQVKVSPPPKEETAPIEAPAQEEPEIQTVSHYQDGRIGFVITEPVALDMPQLVAYDQAVLALRNQAYQDAVDLFLKVLDVAPELTAPHINIAKAYLQLGNKEEAEAHLQKALSLVPAHPLASNDYGLLLRRSGRFDEAREVYEKALDVFPEYLPLHQNLGVLCDLYLDDAMCAYREFSEYKRIDSENQDINTWLAELELRLGENLPPTKEVE